MHTVTVDAEQTKILRDAALSVYRYARRWAVSQSPRVEDAMVYDAALSVLRDAVAPQTIGDAEGMSATADRYERYGPESQPTSYSLPTEPADAMVMLHRFARRYTNGRGTFTALLVNDAARTMLGMGISLDETRELDGTIWAADGVGGSDDGLTPEQHAEAMAAMRDSRH